MPFAPPRPCRNCRRATTEKGGYCQACKRPHEQQRRQTETWRHVQGARGGTIDIYQSTRWKAERKSFLIENPLCVDCKAEGYIVAATDVDHEVPHRGDMMLFWDQGNWRARCHKHHSVKTMRESNERRG